MYSRQDYYESQLDKLGLLGKDAFTCTCYMDEVGNTPGQGRDSFLVRIFSGRICQFGAGRQMQPELGNHRSDGFCRGLCAAFRTAE